MERIEILFVYVDVEEIDPLLEIRKEIIQKYFDNNRNAICYIIECDKCDYMLNRKDKANYA